MSLNHGDYDSAVSRTYYAMYYMVKSVLLTKNIKTKTHSGLVALFGENFVKTNIFPKKMSKQLRNAFGKRLIGDYEFANMINKNEAEEFLKIGQEFVDSIIEYLKKNNFL